MNLSTCIECKGDAYLYNYTYKKYRFTEFIHEKEGKIEKVCFIGMLHSYAYFLTEDFWDKSKSEERDSITDKVEQRRKKYWSSKGISFIGIKKVERKI